MKDTETTRECRNKEEGYGDVYRLQKQEKLPDPWEPPRV